MARRGEFSLVMSCITLLIAAAALSAAAQPREVPRTPFTSEVQPQWLNEVLPEADRFGDRQGEPPVWPGYRRNPVVPGRDLVGYVFRSGDVPPAERGYSGPIDMLIGVDSDHNITGVKILDYEETYRTTKGDFLARADLLDQFRGKPIRDEFRIGGDIDGIAGSTVSVFAVARGARSAARRVAGAYLDFDSDDPVEDVRRARVAEWMGRYDDDQMRAEGIVRSLDVPLPDGSGIQLSFTYLGHPGLGVFWIGEEGWARAERGASAWLGGDEMILVTVGGSAPDRFRYDQLQFQQDDSRPRRFTDRTFVPIGSDEAGRFAGQADFTGALVLPDTIDITRPVTLTYRHLGTEQRHSLEFVPAGPALRLARGEDVLDAAEIAQIQRDANRPLRRFLEDPPWGSTSWGKVGLLAVILALAMTAFLRKNAPLRWATLAATTAWLCFIDGSFLSVSHITNTITQGTGFLVSNLPLLLFVVFTVVTTLLWGRVFCSSLCPFGAVQDFIARFGPRRWRRRVPQRMHDRGLYIKYLVLAVLIGMALFSADLVLFQYFEPFGTLFFLDGALILWVILLAILAACFVVPRFYCRYACPLGAALGLVALVSPLRIRRVPQCTVCGVCEQACPTGAIRREKIDFKECVRCDACEIMLIERAGACRHEMSRIIAASRAYP